VQVRIVGSARRANEKDEVGRAVVSAKVNAPMARADSNGGVGDELRAGVWNADTSGESRVHLSLAQAHVFEVSLNLGDATGGDHALGQHACGGLFRVGLKAHDDQFCCGECDFSGGHGLLLAYEFTTLVAEV
jgi:hypothetical protein